MIRGWVTDRANRNVRAYVDILIDGRRVATLGADRLDPKLVELGEGDGRYAFAMVIPELYRDDRQHAFAAEVRGAAYRLKCKAPAFQVAPEEKVPQIELRSIGQGAVEGRVDGGQFSKSTPLELWLDDHRLDEPVETRWSGPAGALVFRAAFSPAIYEREGRLRIAAPGMIEAGLPAPELEVGVRMWAEHNASGQLTVGLEGDLASLTEGPAELHIYRSGDDRPFLVEPANFKAGLAELWLPPELASVRLTIQLVLADAADAGLSAVSRPTLGRLTRNGAFQRWDARGPAEWRTADAVEFDRGFYSFPRRVAEAQGPSGDFIHLQAPAGEELRPLLVQEIPHGFEVGDRIEAALLIRTSEPCAVHLRLLDAAGAELGRVTVATRRAWIWAYATDSLVLADSAQALAVEISVDGGGAVEVDVAGVRLGGERFREEAAAPVRAGESTTNAVENADLNDWPHGIAVSAPPGRTETARGWFTFNRRSPSPVLVRAAVEEETGRVTYLVATAKTPDYCRLEVRLDPAILDGVTDAVLSFEGGSTAAARRILGATNVGIPEFLLIDRILILRRGRVEGANGFDLVDETLATPGRKLLITRRLHRFELPVNLAAPKKQSDFQWEEADPANSEYYLVLEFRQAFALALRDVCLQSRAAAATTPGDQYLALEDRNIAVQAAQVRGLGGWLSPEVLVPGAPASAAPEAGTSRRWSWSALPSSTVEVVVCVHNAIDETLACLASLIGATSVPHTVRIVDDGSDAQVADRIRQFIADKPWMRLVVNPKNLGYTTSADQGVRQSEADWVILLNSDTTATPGWIEGMLEAVAGDPQVAMVGPVSNAASFQSVPDLYDASGEFTVNALPPGWTPAQMAALVASQSEKSFPEVPLLNGFCTLIKRSVFLEVGGMNPGAFPAGYGEENDLCTRVIKAGYKLVVADHVYVYHAKSASFGNARRQELSKAGGKTLRELHPDIDYGLLTSRFRDLPALVRLRSVLRDSLGKLV